MEENRRHEISAHPDGHEAPGAMIKDNRVRRDAVRTSTMTKQLQDLPFPLLPPLAPMAGWMLLLVPALIAVMEPFLLAHSVDGRGSGLRGTGFAIVIGFAGLRIATGFGRQNVAVVLALLAGTGLLLSAVLAPHDRSVVATFEAVLGAYTVVVALGAGLRPRPERDEVIANRRTPSVRTAHR